MNFLYQDHEAVKHTFVRSAL